jgi:flagellar hook assembly protein FlgD
LYNYPNPFNPEQTSTTLRYSLSKTAQVNIRIYDAGGILVKTLIEGIPMNAGDEQATPWDGRNGSGTIVANGVYFYVVQSSAGERAVGKIAVIR